MIEAARWQAALARLQALSGRLGLFVRRHRRTFYISLALFFFIGLLVNTYVHTFTAEVKARAVDFTIRHRLSSPVPDPKIVILDIDERSLAELAESQGRWPWPRAELAEAIATVAAAGARSIFLNVMLSDPDRNNVNADRIFQYVAAHTPNVAYPLVRLPAEDDVASEVRFSMLNGAQPLYDDAADGTLALLYPYFPATHDKLGIINLSIGRDGILRSYAVYYPERDWLIPSAALRTLQLAGITPDSDSEGDWEILLNWRNKRGDYRRISFAELHAAMNGRGTLDWTLFKDAIVLISASAPGISTVKPTAASPAMDDATILATAIDDLKNDSYLHQLPRTLGLLAAVAVIVVLVFCFIGGVPEATINLFFVVGQSALLFAAVLQASYFNYYLDFTDALLSGMGYFAIAKLYSLVDRRATRGMPWFTVLPQPLAGAPLLLAGVDARQSSRWQLMRLRNRLERHYGLAQVLYIDPLFSEEQPFADLSNDWVFFVVFPTAETAPQLETGELGWQEAGQSVSLQDWLGAKGKIVERRVKPDETLRTESAWRSYLAAQLIALAQELLPRRAAH